MTRITSRVAASGVALALSLALTASNTFAFECYNASRSTAGNEAAAGSPALVSLEEALVFFCGLEPSETGDVIDELAEQGFQTDLLINGHALMAGGLERNGKGEEKLDDGQAIDHLSDEFFEALITLAPSCA